MSLKAENNGIADLTPLEVLVNLRLLTLGGNDLSDASVLFNLKKLKVLKMDKMRIPESQLQALREAFPSSKSLIMSKLTVHIPGEQ